MATIKDISKKTGLGLATISKYLNGGNVRPENKVLIERAIKETNYSVNDIARSLKTKRTHAIGVIVPELNNTFFMQILTEMERILREEGYVIVINDCRESKQLEAETVEFLMNKHVDAIVSFPVSGSGKYLLPAFEKGVPVILIDRTIPALRGKVDSVTIDNVTISREVARFLIERGHRKIGVITGPRGTYTADRRLKGFVEIINESRLNLSPEYITREEFTVEGGRDGFRKIMKNADGITALYATNHATTLGTIIAIREAGLVMPDDISFIGFDSMDWAKINVPSLTIVEQPIDAIGRVAAELLLKRLVKGGRDMPKQSIVLSATLNMGDSVRRV